MRNASSASNTQHHHHRHLNRNNHINSNRYNSTTAATTTSAATTHIHKTFNKVLDGWMMDGWTDGWMQKPVQERIKSDQSHNKIPRKEVFHQITLPMGILLSILLEKIYHTIQGKNFALLWLCFLENIKFSHWVFLENVKKSS